MKTKSWGSWELNMSKPPSLDFKTRGYSVEVPLERVETQSGLNDWVEYLRGKHHVFASDVKDFLQAVKDTSGLNFSAD